MQNLYQINISKNSDRRSRRWAEWSADGVKVCLQKTPLNKEIVRRKKGVARDELVAGIPAVRVADRVGFDVPAVVVPVRVHGREHVCASHHPYHCGSNTLCRCIVCGTSKSSSAMHRSCSFFVSIFRLSHARHAARVSRHKIPEALHG